MALPAGRYGVTKNQLLKIKKLPMNTMKLIEELAEKYDLLGTAAFKNSTSVVTDSSDLVESGAVYDVVKGSVGWVASRNIAPITLDVIKASNTRGTWNGNAYTDRGVTYTINDDLSVSMSGTASGGNSSLALLPSTTPIAFLDAGSYFMSGCPQGGSVETYYLNYAPRPSGSHIWDTGDGLLINNATANQGYNIYFFVSEDVDMTGKVLKVQLEKGTSATPYYPYHASVKDSLAEKADNSVIGTVEGANASKAWSVGEHFIKDGQFKEVTQAISSGGAISDSNTMNRPIADCLLRLLPIFNNAGSHNGIFRGKNLGSSLTTAQKTAIANGSFEDLYIGDYWEINGIKWRIAHFDYWYRSGDTQCTTHHVVVVPDNVLNYKDMNDKVNNADVTTGAYINSKMYTTNIADACTIVKNAFGENNILTHREWFANATNANGFESGGSWYDSQIDLMNEIMVYGSNIFHNCINGTSWPGGNYTIDKEQLALFRLDHSYTIALNPQGTNRSRWWLRDVCNATTFANVNDSGNAGTGGASSSIGVRPAFAIK